MQVKRISACTLMVLLALSVCGEFVTEDKPEVKYGKWEFDHGYTVIRGERYGFRPTAVDNMEFKWVYSTPGKIGAVDVVDLNGDGLPEVLVGLDTGHVIVLDNSGHYKTQFYVGNSSILGKIYAITSSDINNDGRMEVVLGLGGARRVFTYSKTGFETPEDASGGLIQKDKVLYRVIRNYGGVYVLDYLGNILWNYTTPDSIKTVKTAKRLGSDTETIYAGLGDLTVYIYNEFMDYTVRRKECEIVDVINETTYYDEAHCTCDGCRWYDDPDDPEGGECLHTYSYERCEWTDKALKGWNLTEESVFNGSLLLLDHKGNLIAKKDLILEGDEVKGLGNVDNNIMDIEFGKVSGEPVDEVVVASDNGNVYVLNQSNVSLMRDYWRFRTYHELEYSDERLGKDRIVGVEVKSIAVADLDRDGNADVIAGTNNGDILMIKSSGKLLWRQKIDDIVTDIKIKDIEEDGYLDIIVSSRDKKVYVLDGTGTIIWKYNVGKDMYGLQVFDLDRNNIDEIIVFSPNNVTSYEMTEFYIKKRRGSTYYDTAYENLEAGDYTKAMIFAEKAKTLFEDIKDNDNIGRTRILIEKIREELALFKKHEAERYYQDALAAYSVNNLDGALIYARRAKDLYNEVNDEKGAEAIDSFIDQINKEKITRRKMEADGYYTKALSFKALNNYTAALEYVDKAAAIYDEVKYYNGSMLCKQLVIRMGDDHYRTAERYYRARDYKKALEDANNARQFYVKAKDNASINKVDTLIEKLNKDVEKPPESKFEIDYRIFIVALALILIVASIMIRRRKPEYIESEPVKPADLGAIKASDLEPLDDLGEMDRIEE